MASPEVPSKATSSIGVELLLTLEVTRSEVPQLPPSQTATHASLLSLMPPKTMRSLVGSESRNAHFILPFTVPGDASVLSPLQPPFQVR